MKRFNFNRLRIGKSKIIIGSLLFSISQYSLALSSNEMLSRYQDYRKNITDESFPFVMTSADSNGVLSASVRTFFPQIAFSLFAEKLSLVSEWCEFVPLHLNIKACMHDEIDGNAKLGFYVGVKNYQTPDQAELLLLEFNTATVDSVLLLNFMARFGPFGSENYDFQIRAIDADDGVYLEFDLSSEPGLVANLAKLYLSTVGRKKIGFSISGETWGGEPKYVRGQRGGSERNVVRYLLSIQAYFETIGSETGDKLYRKRVGRWFELTQNYKRQLYELSRRDYIAIKMRERKNQAILMESIKFGLIPIYGLDQKNP